MARTIKKRVIFFTQMNPKQKANSKNAIWSKRWLEQTNEMKVGQTITSQNDVLLNRWWEN